MAGILFLKENAGHIFNDLTAISSRKAYALRKPPRFCPGTVIPFTGHLIIFRGGRGMDSFHDIVNADGALELEFDEGLLVSVTDLSEFIEEGGERSEKRESNRTGLQGRYSHSTYTWRFGRCKCVLCGTGMPT